jgi:sRNA-binding carbon storage regulator CsrA
MLLLTRKPEEWITLQIGDSPTLAAIREILENKNGYPDRYLVDDITKALESPPTDIAVRIVVMEIRADLTSRQRRVSLGIDAPASVKILRDELNQEDGQQ